MMTLLQEKITRWIKGKEAVIINISVVLKGLNQGRFKPPLTEDANLKQYCKNVLLNRVVSLNTAVNLLDSKLARTYGICFIIIKKHEPLHSDGAGCVTISQRTCIQIEAVQSEDFYHLKASLTPVALAGFSHEIKRLSLLLDSKCKFPGQPVGVLLHGPPGCGKTSLAKHLAHTCSAVLIKLEASDFLKSDFGAGAASLKANFRRAVELSKEGPLIVFIDEIDTLCPGHENASLGNKQLTSALAFEMDSLHANGARVLVLAATNHISSVSGSLRRPGRFDQEVLISVPTMDQRLQILKVHTTFMNLAPDVLLSELASWTVGFVGADLQALCEEAMICSHNAHSFQTIKEPTISMSDFVQALHAVRPSLKKGLDCTVEFQPVKWEDIGGLEEIKAEIRQAIEWPLLHPDALRRFDLAATKGVLLYGPPGCCKTTLVRAAATSCHVTFLALSGAQVYSPYVGESEKIISEAFQKARALSPSILFFDEMESIVGSRASNSKQSRVQERVLSTMLNEMDGVGIRLDKKMETSITRQTDRDQNMVGNISIGTHINSPATTFDIDKSHVIVIGATNRPDMLDSAILRPGRLDKLIYVPPPDFEGRKTILEIQTSKMPTSGLDLEDISKKTEFFSGADLKNLCTEAGLIALRENLDQQDVNMSSLSVSGHHFSKALEIIKPSLSNSLLQQYKKH